jgi:hypothetical protein
VETGVDEQLFELRKTFEIRRVDGVDLGLCLLDRRARL